MSKVLIFITIILMDLLSGMEFDLFVPSFPELQATFNLSSFWVEALLSVNFIGYCLSLFLVGALADRYGRRPVLLIGLTTFVIGSLFCLWAPSYNSLLVGRFLQGLGVAAPAIISFLIVADSYPLKQQQRYLALLNGVMNIAVGLAPVLGSYISFYFHWQGNFMALLGLGILVLIMTAVFIPNDPIQEKKNTALFSGYLQILKDKPLMLLIGHIVFMVIPYWIFVGMSPLLYMQALGVSLRHFGYYQGALAVVFAIGCFIFGALLQRLAQKTWLTLSLYIFMLSLLSLGWVTWFNTHDPLFITLALMPFIIGQIIPSTILYPVCLNHRPELKGQVSGMIQGSKLILCAVGLQITGFYYRGSFQTIGLVMLGVIVMVVITLWMIVRLKKSL